MLNVDLVTQVRWWEQPDFADEPYMLAAELIAFDVLEPALRSRGQPQEVARTLASDEAFSARMRQLFGQEATGRMTLPTLQDALDRITALEARVKALEDELRTRS